MPIPEGAVTSQPQVVAPRNPSPTSRRQGSAPLPMAAFFTYYLTIGLFVYLDVINIGAQKGAEGRIAVAFLGFLPHADIALCLALGFAATFDPSFRSAVLSRQSICLLAFLGAFSILGVLMGNAINWLRADLRVWMWLYGGLALFRILMNLRRPGWHLLGICLIAGLILCLSAHAGRDQMNIAQSLNNERVWDVNVFNFSGMMLPLLGLVFGAATTRNLLCFLGTLLAFALFFYGGVIVGATRSLAIALAVVCASASLGLLFQRSKTQITSRLSPRAAWVGLLMLCGALAVAATLFGAAFSSSTVLSDRLSGDADVRSGLDRIVELEDALQQLGPVKTVLGGGLGYTFQSIFDYTAISTHLTLFTILLKFGVVPFLLITAYLYLYLPGKFAQALLRPASMPPSLRTALLVTLPGVFAWLTIFAMSGGYDTYYSIGLGMSLGVFLEIKAHGLANLCR